MKSQIKSRYKLMGMLAVMALLLLPFGGLMVGAQNGEAVTIDLVADDLTFDTTEITVPAGAEVAINFDNQDGSPHNFALYADATAQEPVFVGEIVTGGQAVEYRFTAPDEPGTYFFRCDVHPSTMTGDFIVTGATGTPAPDGTATAAPAETPAQTGTAQPPFFPLVSGWYQGSEVQYYDFGPNTPLVDGAPAVAPIYVPVEGLDRYGSPMTIEGQYNIVGAVPGDEGYSDLWQVHFAIVPEAYQANDWRSVDTVTSSSSNLTAAEILVNCPVVPAGSTLQDSDKEPAMGWYQGQAVYYFDFGENPDTTAVIYVPVTGMDDEGNPQTVDGQRNIIDVVPGNPGYTAFWQVHYVMVPEDYQANTLRSFTDVEMSGYEIMETDTLVNCPVQQVLTPTPTMGPSPTTTTATQTTTPTASNPTPTTTTGPAQTPVPTQTDNATPAPTETTTPGQTITPTLPQTPADNATAAPTATVTSCPPGMGMDFQLHDAWYNQRFARYYNFEAMIPYINGQMVTPPMWVPVYGVDEQGGLRVVPGQKNIIDLVPGVSGYSDVWQITLVTVPEDYVPNTLKSYTDILDSGYPLRGTDIFVNCPVVPQCSTLQGGGETELKQGWYRAQDIYFFDFGMVASEVPPIYIIITGLDNLGRPTTVHEQLPVLSTVPGEDGYTGLWLVHWVTVPPGYQPNMLKSSQDIEASGYSISPSLTVVNLPVHDLGFDAAAPGENGSQMGWSLPYRVFQNPGLMAPVIQE